MSVFKIENLYYKYDDGKVAVLKDINYEFEKGKIYAIVGETGAGKTTLLSLMSGLDKPKDGKILYNGKDISRIDQDKYRSQDVGVVFQSFNLLYNLTAVENVALSMDVARVKRKDKEQYAYKLLDDVGIDETKAQRRVLRLSGGEQQRVAIARAISYDPQVILADEPTGNLDRKTEDQIIDIFKKLAHDEDKCVIIVTHSENVANNVDNVYNLNKN